MADRIVDFSKERASRRPDADSIGSSASSRSGETAGSAEPIRLFRGKDSRPRPGSEPMTMAEITPSVEEQSGLASILKTLFSGPNKSE